MGLHFIYFPNVPEIPGLEHLSAGWYKSQIRAQFSERGLYSIIRYVHGRVFIFGENIFNFLLDYSSIKHILGVKKALSWDCFDFVIHLADNYYFRRIINNKLTSWSFRV